LPPRPSLVATGRQAGISDQRTTAREAVGCVRAMSGDLVGKSRSDPVAAAIDRMKDRMK